MPLRDRGHTARMPSISDRPRTLGLRIWLSAVAVGVRERRHSVGVRVGVREGGPHACIDRIALIPRAEPTTCFAKDRASPSGLVGNVRCVRPRTRRHPKLAQRARTSVPCIVERIILNFRVKVIMMRLVDQSPDQNCATCHGENRQAALHSRPTFSAYLLRCTSAGSIARIARIANGSSAAR